MEDLDGVFMPEEVIERIERQSLGKRIDENRLAILAGKRHLDQAEL